MFNKKKTRNSLYIFKVIYLTDCSRELLILFIATFYTFTLLFIYTSYKDLFNSYKNLNLKLPN